MAEFTVHGNNYRNSKMDAQRQFHVVRRLTPLLSSLQSCFKKANITQLTDDDKMELLATIANALSEMPDSEVDYVINNCLDTCQRQQGMMWSKVRSSGGLQFDDITMLDMIEITWQVLWDNLSSFITAPTA